MRAKIFMTLGLLVLIVGGISLVVGFQANKPPPSEQSEPAPNGPGTIIQ